MKRMTILLFAILASMCLLQMEAQPKKGPARSDIFDNLPSGYTQLGNTSIYYSITEREASGPGYQTGVSILGEINGRYYSSTYEWKSPLGWLANGPGAGFIAAFKVNNNAATYVNCATGTTSNGVTFTTRLEPSGDVAARIVYSLKNNNNQAVTINAGVWGDIMIGDNDRAPLERLKNSQETVYGIKMKHSNAQNSPLLCMLFGEGVTGVNTSADDYWFGEYYNNYSANAISGTYSTNIDYYMVENSTVYDCGLGFCWKDRVIEPGETLELSYVVSVGEVDYVEPIVPGEDRFEYEVEAYNIEEWNNLGVAHPAHVWGYYEHPYGQNGYIEYQVDDENTWHRIPTMLISGENFDVPFDMYFNEGRTTDHVLNLRFNDGLDNIIDMDGLSWTDVRSFAINGFEDRPYTGEPQIFEVTIGDGEPFTVGQNGEYTDPGDYTYGIVGVYAENTIGVNEVEFTIGKGQSVINVTIPEDCEYDGMEHAATVQLLVGDGDVTITYVNTETGESTTEAPVEPGTYEVFVSVAETPYYYGIDETSYGTFTIGKVQSVINVTIPEDCEYDGMEHAATVQLLVGDGDVTITYVNTETGESTTEAPVEPGTYEVFVSVEETEHYLGIAETSYGTFTIGKVQSVINVTIPEDCEYDGMEHAATVQLLVGDGDVTITYVNTETGESTTEAPVEPGTYEVFVSVEETEHYLGIAETSYGTFTIGKIQTVIEVTMPGLTIEHDGQPHGATVVVVVGDGEPVVTYVNENGEILTEEPTEVGIYEVFVMVPETDHYLGIGPKSYGTFEIFEQTTGVNELTIGNDDNGAWYTIDGRRVDAPTKGGIYIHNGKKYILK